MRTRRYSFGVAAFLIALPTFAAGYRIAAWIPGWDPNALTSTQQHAGLMSESNPTWYQINSDGSVAKKATAEDPTWRAAMTGTAIMPTIQNTTATGFNATVALDVISTAAKREIHAEAIRQLVASQAYDGVDIDYESLPLSARANFTAFIQLLATKLHADGKKLSVTVYAKTADSETWDGAGGEDYPAIGAAADWVKLMIYDYSWSTSAPGPITPLSWLDQSLAYATSTMPAAKVMAGLPWYGYDWPSKGAAADLTYFTGVSTAQKNAATVTHDVNGEATYKYSTHTAYYLDNFGHDKQVDLILQKYPAIGGFCYWYIGSEDPLVWDRIKTLIGNALPPPPPPPPPNTNPPNAPSALGSSAASAFNVNLSWTDNAADEDGFRVERCTGTQASCDAAPAGYAQVAQLAANATTYADAGLQAITTYSYRVRSYKNVGGNSTYSNSSASTTTADTLPAVPAASGRTLIPTGSTWHYLDNGSDQGTNWRSTFFNDGTWKSGPAELGYGDGDEKTVVSYGPSSTSKYITTYFRYSFTLTDPTAYKTLQIRLRRDDGGIVYLNGSEVFRSNMPAGTVLYNTMALAASDDGNTWFSQSIDPKLLVAGRNVVAVEIHQDAGNSSDITFEAELTGTLTPPPAPSSLLATPTSSSIINLTWADNATTEDGFRVERCNGTQVACDATPTNYAQIADLPVNTVSYAATGLAASGTYTFRVRAYNADGNSDYAPSAAATTLAPPPPPFAPSNVSAIATSSSAVDLTWTDNSTNEDGFSIERCTGTQAACDASPSSYAQIAQVAANATSYTSPGLVGNTTYTYRVRAYNVNGNSPYSASGAATTLAPPPAPPTPLLVSFGSVWKYLDNGTDQGTAWRALSFLDSAWKSGAGQLGYGDGDEKTVVGYGNSRSKYITTYFRQSFNVANPAAFQSLLIRLVRDDGAVIYINGTEVWRSNMPAGTIGYKTEAATGVAGSDESKIWEQAISSSVLVPGVNVIAVEIHQDLPSSSDISFDLELTGK